MRKNQTGSFDFEQSKSNAHRTESRGRISSGPQPAPRPVACAVFRKEKRRDAVYRCFRVSPPPPRDQRRTRTARYTFNILFPFFPSLLPLSPRPPFKNDRARPNRNGCLPLISANFTVLPPLPPMRLTMRLSLRKRRLSLFTASSVSVSSSSFSFSPFLLPS